MRSPIESDIFFPRLCVQLRPTSIEKEIFPFMAEEGHLYAMELQGDYHCGSLHPRWLELTQHV